MSFIKQCKGKDLVKVPKSKLEDRFYHSIKYDGHYVQIHKAGDNVRFFTSSGKEFYVKNVAEELIENNPGRDFILEAEYINTSSGKLGSRGYSAKLTTYRTNFEKGIETNAIDNERFMVFDCIDTMLSFEDRLCWILEELDYGKHCELVDFSGIDTLEECKNEAKLVVKDDYEGLYLKSPNHMYREGKRVNDAIKLKLRPTADLLCRSVLSGDGKYMGMVGSLVLQDKAGRSVQVGSGLSDEQRGLPNEYFIGKVIEIEYEQILATYIQPTFIRVRDDKTKEEID